MVEILDRRYLIVVILTTCDNESYGDAMMFDVLLYPFSCHHKHLTRPMTPISKPGVPIGDTYGVCLDCGKQFTYDWDTMRIGKVIRPADTSVS